MFLRMTFKNADQRLTEKAFLKYQRYLKSPSPQCCVIFHKPDSVTPNRFRRKTNYFLMNKGGKFIKKLWCFVGARV